MSKSKYEPSTVKLRVVLDETLVRRIKRARAAGDMTLRELAVEFRVSSESISNALSNPKWEHVT